MFLNVAMRVVIAQDEFYSCDWFEHGRTIGRVHNDGKHKLEICGIIPAGRGALIYVSGLWMKISMVASHGATTVRRAVCACYCCCSFTPLVTTECKLRVFFSHPLAILTTSDDEWIRSIQVLLLRSLSSKRLLCIDYWLKFRVIAFVILFIVMLYGGFQY